MKLEKLWEQLMANDSFAEDVRGDEEFREGIVEFLVDLQYRGAIASFGELRDAEDVCQRYGYAECVPLLYFGWKSGC